MPVTQADNSGSSRIEAGAISGALEQWLDGLALDGLDSVRAALAIELAVRLDDPAAPHYVLARLAAELRAVVAEITAQPRTQRNVARLLAEVAGG